MAGSLRKKGTSTIVWVLMGFLLLGLAGFGVENFTGGSSSEVGHVGSAKITPDDYTRALQRQMADITRQTGQNVTLEQANALGITAQVEQQLLTGATLDDAAARLGVSLGDTAIAHQMAGIPAFQNVEGKFDRDLYDDFLRRERLNHSELVETLRKDGARQLVQEAIIAGVRTPASMAKQGVAYLREARDFSWTELTEADLTQQVTLPDEATLESWHKANADRFTSPERRRITYLWLTPEAVPDIELDETALRETYEAHIAEYQQPERRMVERLVFPTRAQAEAAKARIDSGEATMETLAGERGLTLADLDLGEMSEADLGPAGKEIFALEQPGVVGPLDSDLGPALFSMNAILEPKDISFEEARPDLAAEASADRARRIIAEMAPDIEDRLASGETLEDIAANTDLDVGSIAWAEGDQPEPGSIGGYPEFREAAAAVTEQGFPEIAQLNDGGIFAIRLDGIEPSALIPFDEVKDKVAEDWRANEVHRRLRALAQEYEVRDLAQSLPTPGAAPDAPAPNTAGSSAPAAPAPADTPADGAPAPAGTAQAAADLQPDWTAETGIERDGVVEGQPFGLVTKAFDLTEPGEVETLDTENRVYLMRLDAVHPADLSAPEMQDMASNLSERQAQLIALDMFQLFTRASMTRAGAVLDPAVVQALQKRIQ